MSLLGCPVIAGSRRDLNNGRRRTRGHPRGQPSDVSEAPFYIHEPVVFPPAITVLADADGSRRKSLIA
jgi:hypothetical protein